MSKKLPFHVTRFTQIYPSPSTESWLESSTASYPDVRADRVGGARPPVEVRDERVGSTDDRKPPKPQQMPPPVTRQCAPQSLTGRVGGEKHEQCHEKRFRNQGGPSSKAIALLQPTIMSTRKICDRKQQVACPQQDHMLAKRVLAKPGPTSLGTAFVGRGCCVPAGARRGAAAIIVAASLA